MNNSNILITLVYEKETIEMTIYDAAVSDFLVNSGRLQIIRSINKGTYIDCEVGDKHEDFGELTSIFYNKQSIKGVIIR